MAHINYKLIGKKRRKKKSHSLSRFSPCGSINLRFPSLSRVPLWSQKSSRHEITAAIRERRNFGENLKIPKKKKKKEKFSIANKEGKLAQFGFLSILNFRYNICSSSCLSQFMVYYNQGKSSS